jgi:glutaconate CoA-transferase subunit B
VADEELVDFLAIAARFVPDRSWVFTGFNWPVLACRTARALGRRVTEVYEAGAALDCSPATVPSSTTDYFTYGPHLRWRGTTLDVMALVPRLDAVLLDAADVDVRGRVNAFGTGGPQATVFRSAGGGGAADAAARARRLVLLHAGGDLARVRSSVEHVTAAPAPGAQVTLVTRWGTARLGQAPRVVELTGHPGATDFARRIEGTEAPAAARRADAVTARERAAALNVLRAAAPSGYRAAARAAAAIPVAPERTTHRTGG